MRRSRSASSTGSGVDGLTSWQADEVDPPNGFSSAVLRTLPSCSRSPAFSRLRRATSSSSRAILEMESTYFWQKQPCERRSFCIGFPPEGQNEGSSVPGQEPLDLPTVLNREPDQLLVFRPDIQSL